MFFTEWYPKVLPGGTLMFFTEWYPKVPYTGWYLNVFY